MSMSSSSPPLAPADTYQVDSEEFDSGSSPDSVEFAALAEEANNGFTTEETLTFIDQLKEQGLVNFLRTYLAPRADGSRQSLRKLLLSINAVPPQYLREPGTPDLALLPFAKVALSRVLRRREKLPHVNTLDDAVELLRNAKRILVLSGAGISTSCGIPDFRSSTGLYAQLQEEGKYELDDPQQMFDITYFREHPEVFYSFAKQIYPSNFVPSPCHRWIKLLEDRGVLLRNYTQNIDTLESLAGVTKVLQCHGSFSTASCLRCKNKMDGSVVEPYIMSQRIPYCEACRAQRDEEIAAIKAYRASKKNGKGKSKATEWDDDSDDDDSDDDDIPDWVGEPGIIKPDIVFFGQALDTEFDECLFGDREEVDLLVIMATSLKVAPVSEVLSHIPHSVPQIFINMTPVSHVCPDISLLGDADSIVTYLSDQLGWTIPSPPGAAPPLKVDPADAVWLSSVDQSSSHVHFLHTKQELADILAADSDSSDGERSDGERSDEDAGSGETSGDSGDSGDGDAVMTYQVAIQSPLTNGRDDDANAAAEAEIDTMADRLVPAIGIGNGSATASGRSSLRPERSMSPASDRPAKRSRVGSVSDGEEGPGVPGGDM